MMAEQNDEFCINEGGVAHSRYRSEMENHIFLFCGSTAPVPNHLQDTPRLYYQMIAVSAEQ